MRNLMLWMRILPKNRLSLKPGYSRTSDPMVRNLLERRFGLSLFAPSSLSKLTLSCIPHFQAGLVVASPSTSNPNYLYTWVRDSSLVFKVLIDQFTSGVDPSLRTLIDDFVSAETDLQQVANPSGNITTGGLGEPKFNIDGSAYTDPWGRPQRGYSQIQQTRDSFQC